MMSRKGDYVFYESKKFPGVFYGKKRQTRSEKYAWLYQGKGINILSAIGQNMAGMMNGMMSGLNAPAQQTTPTPPPIPGSAITDSKSPILYIFFSSPLKMYIFRVVTTR